MAPVSIPRFLLPRGPPSAYSLRILQAQSISGSARHAAQRSFSATAAVARVKKSSNTDKHRILEKPDKFRPPSHPQRIVDPARVSSSGQPVNYGPRLTAEEREAQNKKQYPNMFPPEGTVMYMFLTSRWIHVWIAMSVLVTLASFTFTTNFKANSPFAHLLPPWSGLLTAPIDTISQAIHVYRMDVQHNSMQVREKRHRRIEDAEKRRQFRVAHGLEEPNEKEKAAVDTQSPIAADAQEQKDGESVESDGKKRHVKKWLGIW